jgi:3-isopropylmalate/(R)-2-methylmalate dehydratase small subunit
MANPFTTLSTNAVLLLADDVDTDQIIPARYLKVTSKQGLGSHLFADWRERADSPLLAPGAKEAKVLVTGSNFGCGSSREHAPWALVDFGFRVIVARSFADIFAQNAVKNGLLTVALEAEAHERVVLALEADPGVRVRVDLGAQRLSLVGNRYDASFSFAVDPFAKHCLENGVDELGYILSFSERITEHEQRQQ